MDNLQAKSPCAGLLPLTIGKMSLNEEAPGALTSLAPYKGQQAALSKAMEGAHGVAYPGANDTSQGDGARSVWFGYGQALLIGPAADVELSTHAALVDQSDAWSVVRLNGPEVEAVLSRLVPVDVRLSVFPVGQTARTLVMHMSGSITRVDADTFEILVFRSMADTLVHDMKTAMEAIAARG